MIATLLLAALAAASSCHSNPWWYMSGQVAPLGDAKTAGSTSQLCPTTHYSGALSCCTEESLRETEKRIEASIGAFQMTLDTLELAASQPDMVASLAASYQRQLNEQCMRQPRRKTDTGYANVVAEQTVGLMMLQAVRDGIAPFAAHWGELRNTAVELGRILANATLGAACLACSPTQQLQFEAPGEGGYEEVEDAVESLRVAVKGDDNERFEQLLKASGTEAALKRILREARANIKANRMMLVQAAEAVCVPVELPEGVSRASIQALAVAKVNDWWDDSLLAEDADEAMEVLVEMASEDSLEWAWSIATNFGWMLRQTSFAETGLAGYREAVEELWAYALNCGAELGRMNGDGHRPRAECAEPPKLFRELQALHRTWLDSPSVKNHLAAHPTYERALVLQGLSMPLSESSNAPYRYADLYRLVYLPEEEDDAPEGDTPVANGELFPEIEFVEPGDARTGVGLGHRSSRYDIAAAPQAVARASKVRFDTAVVKPYNPLGSGLPTLSLVASTVASLAALLMMVL